MSSLGGSACAPLSYHHCQGERDTSSRVYARLPNDGDEVQKAAAEADALELRVVQIDVDFWFFELLGDAQGQVGVGMVERRGGGQHVPRSGHLGDGRELAVQRIGLAEHVDSLVDGGV